MSYSEKLILDSSRWKFIFRLLYDIEGYACTLCTDRRISFGSIQFSQRFFVPLLLSNLVRHQGNDSGIEMLPPKIEFILLARLPDRRLR